MGHGPARLTANEPELILQGERIDLVYDAVDIVGKRVAQGFNFRMKSDQRLRAERHPAMAAHRKAESLEGVEHFAVARGHDPVAAVSQPIGKKRQWATRGNRRVELAYCTRGGIARIDETLLTGFPLRQVQAFEIIAAHVDFPAHFEHSRRHTVQAQWNLTNRPDVVGDVLASFSVSPGRGANKHPLFVSQADGKTVELEFGSILNRAVLRRQAKPLANPVIERTRTLFALVGLGVDREHRHFVPHCRKFGAWRPTHPLGR